MHALLVSDIHLAPERPEVTRAFLDFLESQAAKAQALYILGDLFEAWIGDDDPAPLAAQVKQALKALTESGVNVYFQQGNRDFLVGRRFAKETGCHLLPDYWTVTFNDEQVLLLHGDLFCTDDHEYQRFRNRLRIPGVRWLLAHLPLKKRQNIAESWRIKSRSANANKPENIMDVTESAVKKAFVDFKVNQIIHGHTHRPARHQHNEGVRWVLGDWHHKGWYITTENNLISLCEIAI